MSIDEIIRLADPEEFLTKNERKPVECSHTWPGKRIGMQCDECYGKGHIFDKQSNMMGGSGHMDCPKCSTETEVQRILNMTEEELTAEAGGKEALEQEVNKVRRIFNRAQALVLLEKHLFETPVIEGRGELIEAWKTLRYPERESGWQPIETAPKETVGLLWSPDFRGNMVPDLGCVFQYEDGERYASGNYKGYKYTHWMPMPKPPGTL